MKSTNVILFYCIQIISVQLLNLYDHCAKIIFSLWKQIILKENINYEMRRFFSIISDKTSNRFFFLFPHSVQINAKEYLNYLCTAEALLSRGCHLDRLYSAPIYSRLNILTARFSVMESPSGRLTLCWQQAIFLPSTNSTLLKQCMLSDCWLFSKTAVILYTYYKAL